MLRLDLLAGCALAVALAATAPASAQDLGERPDAPIPPPADGAAPIADDQVQFSAGALEYDSDADVVTATGDVRMYRTGERLRADKVVWNRKTGRVTATGNVAITNPAGDVAYGDSIDLSDSLKDGVVQNILVVLNKGGRLAAASGRRETDGTLVLERAAYTPCSVVSTTGCPKNPSWKVTAISVTYRPDKERLYYGGGALHLFGLPAIPLPRFSSPVGGSSESGFLAPSFGYRRVNGFEVSLPYYIALAPNRGITLTPHLFTGTLPLLQAEYAALNEQGAFRITGYATESRKSEDLLTIDPGDTRRAFRGYLDGVGRYQFTPDWSLSGSLRLTTDRTFLRRYDISRDDRLRTTASLQHIDANSYFAVTGWYVQTLRAADPQGMQPIALPEIDYRRLFPNAFAGGQVALQLNSVALTRPDGQDTQRAFASAQWTLRRLTRMGQEVTFTALARGDVYHTNDSLLSPLVYRGENGVHARAIGAGAVDVKWPFVGSFLGGTQRLTPRVQVVAVPKLDNSTVPNEDSRAVDLDTSNVFALNRFPGYDRFEDSTRITYGGEWQLTLPGVSFDTVIGQSYRLSARPTILYPGTGLSDRFSDIVGRSELRYRDFVALTFRYRLDKDNLAIRRDEVDATIGSRSTYLLLGYLRLDRNIFPAIEDLQDREEGRIGARAAFARFWSVFGSAVVDLTNRREDPLNSSDGFSPVRHRVGVQYEDDCLRLGFTWRKDYRNTGDARRGDSYLLTLAFTNLGR